MAVDAERVTRPDAVSALLLLSRYQSIFINHQQHHHHHQQQQQQQHAAIT